LNFQQDLTDSIPLGNTGKATCTYIGTHGHLHWLFKTTNAWYLPDNKAYMFVFICILFSGIPVKHFVFDLVLLTLFFLSVVYTEGTAEATSIWCWSGFAGCIFAFFEPFFF
jgi:hypothetical protein